MSMSWVFGKRTAARTKSAFGCLLAVKGGEGRRVEGDASLGDPDVLFGQGVPTRRFVAPVLCQAVVRVARR